jgi:hypothetical protein
MRLEFEIIVDRSRMLDLMQLIPKKYHNSEVLQALVKRGLNHLVGSWLTKIDDLILLQDPDVVGLQYIYQLGNLLGVEFPYVSEDFETRVRKELRNVIDWYKVKGTYESLNIIANLLGVKANIYDFYTNDYVNFYASEWFVGEEGENPPGFDDTFYKSPHFGFEVILRNKIDNVGEGSSEGCGHLWSFDSFKDLIRYLNQVRPVNTVPHFVLLLDIDMDETSTYDWPSGWSLLWDDLVSGSVGGPPVVIGDIVGRVLVDRPISRIRFDEHTVSGGREIRFDQDNGEGEHWRWDSYDTTFMLSINSWKIGTGNKHCTILDKAQALLTPGFDIETQYASGVQASYETTTNPLTGRPEYIWKDDGGDEILVLSDLDDSWEFEIVLPSETQIEGLSEAVLYRDGEPVVAALFPDIDKDGSGIYDWYSFTGVQLRIVFRLYK